jgi:TPR repeat protein
MNGQRYSDRPRSRCRWLLAAAIWGLLPVAHAAGEGEVAEALQAANDQRYALAYERYLAAAAQGNAEAQLSAGLMAHYGERLYAGEITRDAAVAETWLRAAAAQGSHIARFMLGRMAAGGSGPLAARQAPDR